MDRLNKGRANRRRGEIEATIGGERRVLCLTLGGLAELETAFGAESLNDLAARFSSGRLKASDIIRIIGAGLRGGGNLLSDEDVGEMEIEGGLAGAARIVAELLLSAFGPQGGDGTGAAPSSLAASQAVGQVLGEGATPRP
jgi:hypothetical protein